MEHTYYFDGDKKKIMWTIENSETRSNQARKHIEDYYDRISIEQSKYVALHVGIFWSIGRFIIKNGDTVNVMVDLKTMFDHLTEKKSHDDRFIDLRTGFIRQLIDQRQLTVRYKMIKPSENKSTKSLA